VKEKLKVDSRFEFITIIFKHGNNSLKHCMRAADHSLSTPKLANQMKYLESYYSAEDQWRGKGSPGRTTSSPEDSSEPQGTENSWLKNYAMNGEIELKFLQPGGRLYPIMYSSSRHPRFVC
jgi:hypothetical protein